jgi:pimeloyl-ACP methyl ester carboxylesterase
MKVIVDNLAVEYRDEGQGPVLLMLHGWGNTLGYFDTLCSALTGFRIIRLDAPGFGGSELPHEAWNVEQYARFVADFCGKIGVQPVAILGHSFGGRITTKGVSKGILKPQKIILVASAGVAERNTPRTILYAAAAKIGKTLLAPLPAGAYGKVRRMVYERSGSDYLTTSAKVMQNVFLNMIREDLSADAAKITLPTLLIWGENDVITPLAEGQKLHALVKGSELRIVAGAGHFVYRDDPQEVAKLIKEFV